MNPAAETAGTSAGKKSGSSFVGSMGKAIGAGTAVIGAAVTVAAKKTWDMTNSVAAAGDEIDKMSQKIGISSSAYQEWSYVFERSGASIQGMQTGMKKLSGVIADAASGSETAAEQLAAVGLSIEELDGLSQEQQFDLVVKSLQKMGSGAKRTAAASDLLGKSAVDMGAIFNMTAEETDALRQEAVDYGMVMSEDSVKASAAFQDAMTKLNGTMAGVKNQIIGNLMPGFTTLIGGFTDLIAGNEGATAAIQQGLTSILTAFTTAVPTMITMVTTLAQSVFVAAPQIITMLAQGILEAIPLLLPTVVTLVAQLAASFIELLPQLIEVGVQILVSLIQGITDAIPQLIEMLPTIIESIVNTIADNIQLVIEAGIALLMALVTGLVQATPQLIQKMPELVTTIVSTLLSNLNVLINGAFQLFMGIVTGLGQMIPRLIKKLPEVVSAVKTECKEKVEQLFKDLWKNVKEVFEPVGTWFKTKFQKAWQSIKLVFAGWGSFFSGLWNKIKDKFSNIGSALGTAISDTVKTGINGVLSVVEGAINKAIGIINSAIGLINKLPGVSVGYVSTISLPRLAKGGVITHRTIAEVGEDGAEAIVPLENNTRWIRNVAAEISTNGGTQTNVAKAIKDALLGVTVEMDDREMGRFVERTVSNAVYA